MSEWLQQHNTMPILLAQAKPGPTVTHTATGTPAPAGTHTATGASVPAGTHTATGASAPAGTHTATGASAPTGTHTATSAPASTGTHAATSTPVPAGTHTFTGTSAPAVTHTAVGTPAPAPAESAHETSPWVFYGFSVFSFLLIIVLVILGTRRLRVVPRTFQSLLEMLYEFLYGLPEQVMGPRGRQYAPFISTFFIYILVMNALGLIPAFKSATASLSITLGMALVAFFGVQYFGFKAQGIKYLAHFLGPVWWMAWLIGPLEVVSELVRPVSLSMRLYGNLFGEEQLVSALAHNLTAVAPVAIVLLQVLTVVLQAFVFTLLVTVYIALATEHNDEHAGAEEVTAHA